MLEKAAIAAVKNGLDLGNDRERDRLGGRRSDIKTDRSVNTSEKIGADLRAGFTKLFQQIGCSLLWAKNADVTDLRPDQPANDLSVRLEMMRHDDRYTILLGKDLVVEIFRMGRDNIIGIGKSAWRRIQRAAIDDGHIPTQLLCECNKRNGIVTRPKHYRGYRRLDDLDKELKFVAFDRVIHHRGTALPQGLIA